MHRINVILLFIIEIVLSSPTATLTAQSGAQKMEIAQGATSVCLPFAGAGVTTSPTMEIGGRPTRFNSSPLPATADRLW
ncbi:MAG TPA: hypothetical protein VFZ66_13625 [Herpetosiphonaceae bacterium]